MASRLAVNQLFRVRAAVSELMVRTSGDDNGLQNRLVRFQVPRGSPSMAL